MPNNVDLIDPIKSVSSLPNGTPNYEELFIFAELLAERRERSVLTLNSTQNSTSLQTELSNANVNMLGVDFNKDVKNSSTFTTKWTDNVTNTTTTLEGFGIDNIEVNISSSFIPTVKIEFVDIRGMTFFNLGENSPYSVIFDFPPPLFKMTLKGYYGKSLDYDLHLVKHSTRFDSKNGNYYISVEFVARTFAPLSDVPFKFVELLSLMATGTEPASDPKTQESAIGTPNNSTNQEELNFDPRVQPRNTFELLEKLKRLTDELKDLKNISPESEAYDKAKAKVVEGDEVISYMDTFAGEISNIFREKAYICIVNHSLRVEDGVGDTGMFKKVPSTRAYNTIIKNGEDAGNNSITESTRMYLGVLHSKIRNGNKISTSEQPTDAMLSSSLTNFSKNLIRKGEKFAFTEIKNNDIKSPVSFNDYKPSDGDGNSTDYDIYVGLDVTNFYMKIDKELKAKRDKVTNAKSELVTLINSKIKETLGFKPSLYNIFKILCDDVDVFFRELGKVSLDGERHHEKYFNRIIDKIQEVKSKNVTKRIYPFPLYIETDITCGAERKVRKIPPENKENKELTFPETNFINQFIDAMIALKKRESVDELITRVDANGNNEWIPITPADSQLYGSKTYKSPYIDLEFDNVEPNTIDALYSRLINRFYIASQYTFGDSFYSDERNASLNINLPPPIPFVFLGGGELKTTDLISYLATSEAINVSNSIINNDVLNSLIDKANIFKYDVDEFYKQTQNLGIYNAIPDGVPTLSNDETKLPRDRSDSGFIGMSILSDPPSKRVGSNANDPISIFLKDTENTFIDWMFSSDRSNIKEFTSENIPYFSDGDSEYDFTTSYLNNLNSLILEEASNSESFFGFLDDDSTQREYDGNFARSLISALSYYTKDIADFLSGSTNKNTKAFVLASMFGTARSYFSEYGEKFPVNNNFLTPAVIEVPNFSTYYMGALEKYNTDATVKSEIDNLIANEEWFKGISLNGQYIIDDLTRFANLATSDKEKFELHFNEWVEINGFQEYFEFVQVLIKDVNLNVPQDTSDTSYADERYDYLFNLIDREYQSTISKDMMKTVSILNFSEYTFKNVDNTTVLEYKPLVDTNANTTGSTGSRGLTRKAANDFFFKIFWRELSNRLPSKKDDLDKIESDFKSAVNDEDIKTQLYYSFKNISDKWVSGIDTSKRGFPLNNDKNDSLISKFAFVDRAMNPIGEEVIINAEALIEMSQDYDINMFQVFSRLLSINGFEFFPLQNFMSFNDKDGKWGDAFKIFTNLKQNPTPAFVCMYIGGTSSTLENSSSAFDNDGILDLQESGLPDFNNISECSTTNEVVDSNTRPLAQGEARFKYSEPKAFRVRYGEQNQSFFMDIQLDGREFTETADSLAILSRIAGDGKTTAPIPKGQNMFSVYENRAYSVTVTMLGNVMIQPTQYFQIENIPMYSGAYMITDVNHKVTANHMVTVFKGVKILKYPNQFVRDFATIVGIDAGTSDDLSGENLKIESISASALPNQELYNNSMFDLELSPE